MIKNKEATDSAAVEFCSHFEQIADPPNFLRKLALKLRFRQKTLKLRHSSNWAANLFKIWQNSNASLSVAYLFFIIYLKSIEWTITRLKNSSGVYGRQHLSHRSKLSFYSLQPFHNHFTFFLAKSNSVCKNIISSFIS